MLVYSRGPGALCGVYLFAPVCLCRYNQERCKLPYGRGAKISCIYQSSENITLKFYMQNTHSAVKTCELLSPAGNTALLY